MRSSWRSWVTRVVLAGCLLAAVSLTTWVTLWSQEPARKKMFGPGPGGPGGAERKLAKKSDLNHDGKLDSQELQKAREEAKKSARGPGGPGFFGPRSTAKPGAKISPDEVKPVGGDSLYDPSVLRTFFLTFADKDWEAELSDFYRTDIEVPAELQVDGKKYKNVGVGFRGQSSYFTVPVGMKRSFSVSLDAEDKKQRLLGYKSLNLLNAHDDASMVRTVLYANLARRYMPAPKANFVKLVVNEENWGIYTNIQQFNKEFLLEHFPKYKGEGARFKVPGNPGADGGLAYRGADLASYKERFSLKSGKESAWNDLINLCKVLTETPIDELEAKLEPILDIEGALTFLALDIASVNMDGYWTRGSDYSLYLDPDKKFHVIPHDMNEAFGAMMGPPPGMMGGLFGGPPGGPPGGPGGPPPWFEKKERPEGEPQDKVMLKGEDGPPDRKDQPNNKSPEKKFVRRGFGPGGFGPGGGGPTLDPLVGMDDQSKPLRSRMLKVPSLRKRYLEKVRLIAEQTFEPTAIDALLKSYQSLIEKEVEQDTKKLGSDDDFKKALADLQKPAAPAKDVGGADKGKAEGKGKDGAATKASNRGRQTSSIRQFIAERRAYLLNHPEIKKLKSE